MGSTSRLRASGNAVRLKRVSPEGTNLSVATADFRSLKHTDLSCKEIAQRCRFGSYSSFYRSLKEGFNQSPEELRAKFSEF
jgi:hypothetical protein